MSLCRSDLNHPPTAVGGISTFCARQSVFRIVFMLSILLLAGNAMAQSGYSLRSPDQKIEVRIRSGGRFKYDVLFNGKPVLLDSSLSIKIDQTTLGLQSKIKN